MSVSSISSVSNYHTLSQTVTVNTATGSRTEGEKRSEVSQVSQVSVTSSIVIHTKSLQTQHEVRHKLQNGEKTNYHKATCSQTETWREKHKGFKELIY